LVTALSLAATLACGGSSGGGPTNPPPASARVLTTIAIVLTPPALQVGQTATLTLKCLDQFGEPIAVGSPTWTSDVPSVATVTADGQVEALAIGEATVTAAVGGKQGFVKVRVSRVQVASLSVEPSPVALLRGKSRQMQAVVRDYARRPLADRAVTWASADTGRARVSSSGLVTALGQGEVVITATSEGVSGSATVTVAGSAGAVATVTVSPAVATVTTGDTLQLAATLRDVSGNTLTGRDVVWTVSVAKGSDVAQVSPAGVLTATSVGEVVVEAASEGQRGAARLTVIERVDSAIVVSIASPKVDQIVADTLLVVAAVRSPKPLASVVAVFDKKSYVLREEPLGARGNGVGWVVRISLALVRYGPYTVTVVATDVDGGRGLTTVTFKRGTVVGEGGSPTPPRNKLRARPLAVVAALPDA
jgi:uncharacterized protein YjdB